MDEKTLTLLASLQDGDLRPLADEILFGKPVDPFILYSLALMISSGEVIAKGRITVRRPRGRPKNSYKSVGDRLAAQLYEELRKNFSHDDALLKAANRFKTTPDSVRKAITTRRNNEK